MITWLHTFQPSPIIATIGPLSWYWYSVFIVAGMIAAIAAIRPLLGKIGVASAVVIDLAFWLIISGIVGARFYYVVYAWSYYGDHLGEVFAIWQGGLAIHGAIIAGLIAGYLFTRRHRLSLWSVVDSVAAVLPLGQAIGRWGNYFNQELFGAPTDVPWGIPIAPANRPAAFLSHQYFHPTFIYESFLDLLLFILLYTLARRGRYRPGTIVAGYLFGYSLIRFSMEFLRTDYSPMLFGIRWAQIVSGVVMVGVAGWWVWQFIKTKNPA